MSRSPFVAIKLCAGWRLDETPGALRGEGRRAVPPLPGGARLVPALALPAAAHASAVERELARFIHLRLPDRASLSGALSAVRSWDFVEHAAVADDRSTVGRRPIEGYLARRLD